MLIQGHDLSSDPHSRSRMARNQLLAVESEQAAGGLPGFGSQIHHLTFDLGQVKMVVSFFQCLCMDVRAGL